MASLSFAMLIVGLAGVADHKYMPGAMIGVALGHLIIRLLPIG